MTYSIKHLFHIAAPRAKVYDAIRTIKGLSQWWTVGTSGSDGLNGILSFRFGEMDGPNMEVTKLIAGELVEWTCVSGADEWVGTKLTFALDENEGKTRVRFEQRGWPNNDDFYASCCFSWGRYMESLRQLCQTGKGEGHGTPGYRR